MVQCPVCGQSVDWVTMDQAARILGVSKARIGQFIRAGRLPGAIKHRPHSGINEFWKIPIDSLLALYESRKSEGLYVNV